MTEREIYQRSDLYCFFVDLLSVCLRPQADCLPMDYRWDGNALLPEHTNLHHGRWTQRMSLLPRSSLFSVA